MSSNLLTMEAAESRSFKQQLKIGLGHACSVVFKERASELFESPNSYPGNLKDKLLMSFLKEKARSQGDSRFFDRLHADFWRGEGGEVFSSNCNHRFEDLFLAKQAEDFSRLRQFWSQYGLKHIVEIGCCAGLHLQHMTENLKGVVSATGIDINPKQIQMNRDNPSFDRRIEFIATDGFQWVLEEARAETLFVTNGGVFEYFSRKRLARLFQHVSSNLSPAMFFTVEPVATDDAARSTESIPFGEELSFSHHYRNIYESSGFHVLHQRPVDYDSWRMMTLIAAARDKATHLTSKSNSG